MDKSLVGLFGVAACAAAVLLGAGAPAWADGALAVGSTGDVVRDGIAFGMVVDEPRETAAETAVKRCQTFKARAAAERCQVVATFSGECFAVAYDPKPGTPGAGWGVGRDQLAANQKAIAMCEATAGQDRKGFCQVESAGCDTTGQRGAGTAARDPAKTVQPQARESAPLAAPELGDRWSDLREMLRKEEQSRFNLDAQMLLLLGGIIGGAGYLLHRRFLKGKGEGEGAAGKPSRPKSKARAKAKRNSR